MREISLTQGKVALVDDEDYEWLSAYKWCYTSPIGYAVTKVRTPEKQVSMLMHRLIMNAPTNLVTDHINHNKLDNRRENLRLCTRQENNRNMPMRSNNTSGYKGVYWHKARSKWQANIRHLGEEVYLGVFEDKHEAALAYNEKAAELFGEFASLNTIIKEAA